jgi:hypothetical protein
MADGFTWLSYPETGGTFRCPDGAVEDWKDMGWEPCDPPEETNPAIADRLALERELQERAAAQAQPVVKKSAAKPAKPAESEES